MTFQSLGLIKPLVQAIQEQGYNEPTLIQQQAIPAILSGKDVLASAQTGTGKTAGFVLPVLQKLVDKPAVKKSRTKVLILTPTRELAAQVYESVKKYGCHLKLRSTVVFGGVKITPQIRTLQSGVDILVATPGRLLDLHQQQAIYLDQVDTFILDEADRMLDMGFIHDIKKIIKLLPRQKQNLLFSATFKDEIRKLVKGLLNQPIEIDVAPRNTTTKSVKQVVHPVDKKQKAALLSHLIHKNKWDQTLVFMRTKHGANKLVKQLDDNRIIAAAIHGNKSQSQRTKALADFKSGQLNVLVATDIAARGLDIVELPCVINFDLPQVAEDYVHRIGRTGRASARGIAISLVSADEINQLLSIEALIKTKIQRNEIEDFEPEHQLPTKVVQTKPASPKKNKWRGKNKAGPQGRTQSSKNKKRTHSSKR